MFGASFTLFFAPCPKMNTSYMVLQLSVQMPTSSSDSCAFFCHTLTTVRLTHPVDQANQKGSFPDASLSYSPDHQGLYTLTFYSFCQFQTIAILLVIWITCDLVLFLSYPSWSLFYHTWPELCEFSNLVLRMVI